MASVTETPGVVAEHFRTVSGEWGRRYDVQPRRMSDLNLRLRREAALRCVTPLADPHRRPALLDVGCGAGNLLECLPRGAFALHGVDLVPEMVCEAARRNPDGRFWTADAAHLPVPEATMDVVTCLGVLEYVPQPSAALRELRRVLKPDGRLVVSFPNAASLLRPLSRLEIALEERAAAWLRRVRGRPPEAGARPAYEHRAWSLPQIRALLGAADLEPVEVRALTYGPWGRAGRWRAALALSQALSERWRPPLPVAARLASTFVLLARCRRGAAEPGGARP